jgi:hypothetical protein
MTTTQEALDLTTFADKKVNITFRPEGNGEPVEKEGTVQAASAIGLIFKEKGKADVLIIEPDWIDSISAQAEKEPNVTVKKLQPVTKNFRQHLADRHGYLPKDLNEITEEQGKEIHDGIDHTSLAHKHETPQAQADAADTPIPDQSDVEGAEPEADAA